MGAAAARRAGGAEGGSSNNGSLRKGRGGGSNNSRDSSPTKSRAGAPPQSTAAAAAVGRGPWWKPAMVSDTSLAGLYLFALQALVLALVFGKALHNNQGRKFVRVKQEGCHIAWADMGGDHSTIACCSRTDPHDPERWDAAICTAATSAVTPYLTSGLACVLPFLTLALNALFSWRHPREVKAGQRRRFLLYAFIIAFRTAGLLICLNRLQAHLQSEEGDSCWYSPLRHDGKCRERFDFADHGVLFISQYLTIQTFELMAVLREATNPLHLFTCLAAACLISLASLLGFYATVSYFHTRLESAVALLLSLLTVQLPLLLIISGRLGEHRWARLSHYVRR